MKNLKSVKKYVLLIFTVISLTSCGTLKIVQDNCIGTCADGVSDFKSSNHRVKLSKAKDLYNNYNELIKPSITIAQQENIPRDTTRNSDGSLNEYKPTEYVLINIDTLKCYLKFLEEVEQKNAGNENSKITGIAVFLGANNSDETLENKLAAFNSAMMNERLQIKEERSSAESTLPVPLDEDIRGRLGVFFAPTFKDTDTTKTYAHEEQRHQPFYIEPEGSSDIYQGKYRRLLDYFSGENIVTDQASNYQGSFGNYENYTPNIKLNLANNSNSGTTLILNEFTQMPPKKPKGTE